MKIKELRTRLALIITIVLIGSVMRLVPHWPNFTPVAAIALFAGASIDRKWLAYIIPLITMLLSDLILGFHSYIWAVYAGFIFTVSLGFLLRSRNKPATILGASLVSSTVFYLLTNFAVWLGSPFYSQDITGLATSYAAGIPFFLNGIAGDVFYNAVFFGGYFLVARQLEVSTVKQGN